MVRPTIERMRVLGVSKQFYNVYMVEVELKKNQVQGEYFDPGRVYPGAVFLELPQARRAVRAANIGTNTGDDGIIASVQNAVEESLFVIWTGRLGVPETRRCFYFWRLKRKRCRSGNIVVLPRNFRSGNEDYQEYVFRPWKLENVVVPSFSRYFEGEDFSEILGEMFRKFVERVIEGILVEIFV